MPYCTIDEAWSQQSMGGQYFPPAPPAPANVPSKPSTVKPVASAPSSIETFVADLGEKTPQRTYKTQEGHHNGSQASRFTFQKNPTQVIPDSQARDPDFVPEPFPRPSSISNVLHAGGQMPGYMSAHNMPVDTTDYRFAPDMDTLSQYSQAPSAAYRSVDDSYYTLFPKNSPLKETFQDFQGFQNVPYGSSQWTTKMAQLERENKRLHELIEKYKFLLEEKETQEPRRMAPTRSRSRESGLMDFAMFVLSGILVIFILENIRGLTTK